MPSLLKKERQKIEEICTQLKNTKIKNWGKNKTRERDFIWTKAEINKFEIKYGTNKSEIQTFSFHTTCW